MGLITKIGQLTGLKRLEFIGRDIDIKKQIRAYEDRQKELVDLWKNGSPENTEAPHYKKQETILSYQDESGARVLIETGTYLGKMMEAMQPHFDKLISIEISEYLNQRAKKLFSKYPNLQFELGDSGVKMAEVIQKINEPILFWLDGHYSGGITGMADIETPIVAELKAIFAHSLSQQHIILIDDARLFNGQRDYPKYEDLYAFIKKENKHYYLSIVNDIIVIKYKKE